MASGIRFKANLAGFRELRNSAGAMEACMAPARAACARANAMTKGEFVADVRPGKTRCHAMVKPADGPTGDIAARDNLRENVLLRAKGW